MRERPTVAPPPATRPPESNPPRGSRTLYMRDVDARVADEVNRIAVGRRWTQAQLVAQLLELRRGCLDFVAEHPNEMSRPVVALLERLNLFPVEV